MGGRREEEGRQGLDGELAPWLTKAVDTRCFCFSRGRVNRKESRKKEGSREGGREGLGSSECFLPFLRREILVAAAARLEKG